MNANATQPDPSPDPYLDLIEAYLAGGLTDAERQDFEAHVANCSVCTSALEEARHMDTTLNAMFLNVRPRPDFDGRILKRLRWSSRRAVLVHPMVRRVAWGVAATVVVGTVGYVATTVSDRPAAVGTGYSLSPMESRPPNAFGYAYDSAETNFAGAGLAPSRASGRSPDDMARDSQERLTRSLGKPDGTVTSSTPALQTANPRLPADQKLHAQVNLEDKLGETYAIPPGEPAAAAGVSGPAPAPVPTPLTVAPPKLDEADRKPAVALGFKVDSAGGPRGGEQTPTQFGRGLKETSKDYFNVTTFAKPLDSNGTQKPVNLATNGNETDGRDLNRVAAGKDLEGLGDRPKVVESRSGDQKLAEAELQVAVVDGEKKSGAEAPKSGTDAPPVQHRVDPAAGRKIIRNGEMTFEVDGFDSTVMTITKIVDEESGFVATTDSDKLANGKVKGTITLRVPPEHLDTLVLKLRGVGDLKSQKINAQDITKQYTDLDSGLRAGKAMYERLLEIIKTGKGEVKDLLEAEKQLGVWREKIEQLEGEKRYYDNLVSLSTLTITLIEKDIKAAAFSSEREQVSMSLETQSVEDAYTKVRDAIAAAKGRIIQSELKQYEAGQYGASVTAEVPPDAAEALIGRLKQIEGRVASYQRQRSVMNHAGGGASAVAPPLDPSKVKREDTKFSLTLYNLANVAPRRTLTLRLAAANVDETYRKILDDVVSAGGRVVTSNINRPKPEQTSASIQFQVPSEKAEVLMTALRAAGEVMRTETTDNPDTQNVTEAKRGFVVQVDSLAATAPRQTEQLTLAAQSVPDTFADLLAAVRAKEGRVLTSQLNQQDRENVTGTLDFEIPRDAEAAIDAALKKAGDVVSRNVSRSQDAENTVDSKVRLSMSLVSAQSLAPRQQTTLGIEVTDVARATEDLLSAARGAGGKAAGPTESSRDRNGHSVSRVVVEVPLDKAAGVIDQLTKLGDVRMSQTTVDEHVPEGRLARARLEVTLANTAATLGGDETTLDAIKSAFTVSGAALRWTLRVLIVGISFVLPVALLIWLGYRMVRRGNAVRTVPPTQT